MSRWETRVRPGGKAAEETDEERSTELLLRIEKLEPSKRLRGRAICTHLIGNLEASEVDSEAYASLEKTLLEAPEASGHGPLKSAVSMQGPLARAARSGQDRPGHPGHRPRRCGLRALRPARARSSSSTSGATGEATDGAKKLVAELESLQ